MIAQPALETPHRRYNPLTGEWVLVSPHRTQRPWLGQVERSAADTRPSYDPDCYLCPGNTRAGGNQNPHYTHTFVFQNDFSALLPNSLPEENQNHPLFSTQKVRGECRVICFSSRHDLTLPEMEIQDIRHVVDVWAEQFDELRHKYRWVQIFENKGEIMGCSNPHPHGQVWAIDTLPNEPTKEDRQQRFYFTENKRSLLMDYAILESKDKERVVLETRFWLALVPFWATWPFEILLLPRWHVLNLCDVGDEERNDLAGMLKRLLTRYDNLFETSFPYSMGWHCAPQDNRDNRHWQLHAHFYPPLLRSATVKKFMVGYEMLAEAQRDITPEEAAYRLRAISDTHYKKQQGGR